MSKERLSKLQKWILVFLYEHKDYKTTTKVMKSYARHTEGVFNPKARTNAIDVTFSRSLRSLYFKRLIDPQTANPWTAPSGRAAGRRKNFSDEGNIKWLYLTDEGKAKAKELLNVKNPKLNNKKNEVKK